MLLVPATFGRTTLRTLIGQSNYSIAFGLSPADLTRLCCRSSCTTQHRGLSNFRGHSVRPTEQGRYGVLLSSMCRNQRSSCGRFSGWPSTLIGKGNGSRQQVLECSSGSRASEREGMGSGLATTAQLSLVCRRSHRAPCVCS